jgi:hypothetical protein
LEPETPTAKLKIHNELINLDCKCIYTETETKYSLYLVDDVLYQRGPIYNLDPVNTIIIDGINHEDLTYNFPLSIYNWNIINDHFKPEIADPSSDNHWLISITNGVDSPTFDEFLLCRNSLATDKYTILPSLSMFYFVARNKDGDIITHTGRRKPVYLSQYMHFNIDDNIQVYLSYDFNLWYGTAKLYINECDPLIAFKTCDLDLCRSTKIIVNDKPQNITYGCLGKVTNHTNSSGLINNLILHKIESTKQRYMIYKFLITNEGTGDFTTTPVAINTIKKYLPIYDEVYAKINFDIDINNKNLNPDAITDIKIQAFRSCCNICTDPRSWDCGSKNDYTFNSFNDFFNYFKYGDNGKGVKIGVWEIRLSRTLITDGSPNFNPLRLPQTIYDRSHVICRDNQTIILDEIIIVDEKNYLRCDLSIPIKKAGNPTEDKNFVRSDPGNTLTLTDNFYYKVTANDDLDILPDPDPLNPYTLQPNTLLELYYQLGDDRPYCNSNKLQLEYVYTPETEDPTHGHIAYNPIFDYFTFSAIVETERSYFVQAAIEWYDVNTPEYPNYFKVDRGPIINTANDNVVFAVTRLTESVGDKKSLINWTAFCNFKIQRVNDPINNLPIRYNEVYHISRLNFFQNNLRIFESPCYKKPDECWFNFNGIESFLWGISIQPSTDQLLSEVKVESWSSNNFDGDKIGKSRYEPIKVTIPCIVDLNKKDPNNLLSDVQYTEQLINNIFREYLVNRRDENGILKTDNTLLISYSPDRKYRGYISSVEEVELDAEKMQAKFKLEFTSPEGNYLKGNYELGRVISLPYDTLLKPFIYIKHYGSVGSDGICLPGPINYRIHDRLSMQDFTLSGWIGNANKQPGKTGFLQIDCFNKKIYFKAAKFKRKAVPKTENPTGWYLETIEKEEEVRDVTRQIPFYLNWLEISQGYWIDIYYQKELKNEAWVGIMGGEIINRIQ